MFSMTSTTSQHSGPWLTFTYASFVASLALVGGGILYLPLEMWIKGYFLMGTAMLVQSCITLTKTVRDVHEGERLLSKLEEARTERLLMDIEQSK